MKKVVIISSSMRKGNSDKLAEAFCKGAVEGGNHVDKINLRDIKLNFCTGCRDCYNYGDCTIHDDMNKLYPLIREADVLVFATPIYFGNMSGALKTFIDRMYPLYTSLSGKEVYIIASCYQDDEGFVEASIESLKRAIADFGIKDFKPTIYGIGCDEVDDVTNSQIEKAYKAGKGV